MFLIADFLHGVGVVKLVLERVKLASAQRRNLNLVPSAQTPGKLSLRA